MEVAMLLIIILAVSVVYDKAHGNFNITSTVGYIIVGAMLMRVGGVEPVWNAFVKLFSSFFQIITSVFS